MSNLNTLKRFKSTLRRLSIDAREESANRTLEASLWTIIFNCVINPLDDYHDLLGITTFDGHKIRAFFQNGKSNAELEEELKEYLD